MAVHKISAGDKNSTPKKSGLAGRFSEAAKLAREMSKSKAGSKTRAVATPKIKAVKAVRAPRVKKDSKLPKGLGWLGAIGGYFKGAWHELREVRWPNRRTTWSMTGAILLYTALMAAIILLLDAAYKALFELILK